MGFFYKMISGEDHSVSSRRVLSLFSFILLVIVVIAAIFGKHIPEYMFYGILGLILTPLGMTTIKR